MSHKELVKLSSEPEFAECRDLVLEGLSLRLKTYENVDDEETPALTINLNPRTNYELPIDPEEELRKNKLAKAELAMKDPSIQGLSVEQIQTMNQTNQVN